MSDLPLPVAMREQILSAADGEKLMELARRAVVTQRRLKIKLRDPAEAKAWAERLAADVTNAND